MPNLLLVASKLGYQTRRFAERARALGYDLQLATDRCGRMDDPWGDDAIPLKFHKPETAALVEKAGHFDGIVAVGDRPAQLAAVIAERLGIPFHPSTATGIARDKHAARQCFAAAGLSVPAFRRIPLQSDPYAAAQEQDYPCVLKPLGLSASRGVIRADNPEQFVAAFRRIRAILSSPDIVRTHEDQDRYVLVEQYIPGREFAVEAIVQHGRVDMVAIWDKPDPLDGPFFEESIYITPSSQPPIVRSAIADGTASAVAAVGLTHGPVHAEMRVNDAGVWMLEVAARPIGGLCAQALRFANGDTLEDLVLRHAAGQYDGCPPLADPARGVMMIPIPREGMFRGASGVESAAAVPGIEDVMITAKEGQRMLPLPEGASYLGFIFARGESPRTVEAALREAHSRLEFDLAGVLPVLGSSL